MFSIDQYLGYSCSNLCMH